MTFEPRVARNRSGRVETDEQKARRDPKLFDTQSITIERLYDGPTGEHMVTYTGQDWDGLKQMRQKKCSNVDEARKLVYALIEDSIRFFNRKDEVGP